MTSRREFIKKTTVGATAISLMPTILSASTKTAKYISKRPPIAKRKFISKAIEKAIANTKNKITDPKLAWLFENCFPNTIDTTVELGTLNGKPDTFVITGDIHAMWLRDSSAQVWPYLPFAKEDKKVREMLRGVIFRQTHCVLIDPYANAFNKKAVAPKDNYWSSDITGSPMKSEVYERKWEIDSLCYTIRLIYNYWKKTGDTSVFDADWQEASRLIVKTFKEQQRKEGKGDYHFLRITDRQLDTVSNVGYGRPLKPVGLINSTFRPSDDNTTFGFLIPSNLFAVKSLKQMAEIHHTVLNNTAFAIQCEDLATEVNEAINKYGIIHHAKYGNVYAYEVDGFGNHVCMDDANVPSLLGLPYLDAVSHTDTVYQNTRKLLWSSDNPYFFKGKAGEGIGSPHIGTYDMIWPMSIIIRALTSKDNEEIRHSIKMLRDTDANTGFMHETFNKDNPDNYTRSWFAWANTLFGELILKLVNEGKANLINNL